MTHPIKVGLIGCGSRLRGLAGMLLNQSDNISIAGCFDPLADSIERARSELNPEAPVYENYEDMLARNDIDWVMIGSYNNQHREQVVAAFEAGKDVFCEKPLATTWDDCLAMRRAWLQSGRRFSIGFTLRYSPHYRKVHELIEEGRIGDIISLEFNETLEFNHGGYIMGDWRRKREYAGSHLLEKCCHDIDLANWMTASRAWRVASFGGLNFYKPENAHHIDRIGYNQKGEQAYRAWPGTVTLNPFTSDKDIVDNQVAVIEYDNGIRATFHTNCNAGIPERRMYICGSEGTIRADVMNGQLESRRIGWDTKLEKHSTGGSGGHGGGDQVLIKELHECMVNGSEPFTGLEDALNSAITCFAIDEAMDTGQVVDMTPYWAF